MFFNVYGSLSLYQLIGWALAFVGLIVCNELARRTKIGGIIFFLVIPGLLTLYFIVLNIWANVDSSSWAAQNWTYTKMNSWFHYAKLYAATIGCIGFMMIKYGWGIGKKNWFKPFPFLIVAINILIACASDFESAIKGALAAQEAGDATIRWWKSSEGVWLYGGWWNTVNGIAGLVNIACMTGWWGIYTSKKKQDMLWPDMTWVYIIAYDVWNFEYTYNNLPTHAWYCGLALLLAPTFANMFWNKGGWIQNRANTLAIWCMFAQVVPYFQDQEPFSVVSSVYGSGATIATATGEVMPTVAEPKYQGIIAVLALVINIAALTLIITKAIKTKTNPYKNEIFTYQRDFKEAMERREDASEATSEAK